jgi:hypothetical protein
MSISEIDSVLPWERLEDEENACIRYTVIVSYNTKEDEI